MGVCLVEGVALWAWMCWCDVSLKPISNPTKRKLEWKCYIGTGYEASMLWAWVCWWWRCAVGLGVLVVEVCCGLGCVGGGGVLWAQ